MKIIQAGGQTCNKFWIYANYIADSIKTGERIIILSPDIQFKNYPDLIGYKNLKHPFYYDKLSFLIGYNNNIKLLQLIFENNLVKKFFKILFYFVPLIDYINATVGVHVSQNLNKEKKTIAELFSPNENIKNEVSLAFDAMKTKAQIICGIHIRRGDYKTFKNGRYYYSDIQYHFLMLRMRLLFPNQQVSFFVSSNEKIDLSLFTDCDCFVNTKATASKDLFGLTICDYIIGPPSTYSGWASYCGNVPLYFIEDPEIEFGISSFKDIMKIWYLQVPS